jgi:hypothetical protein
MKTTFKLYALAFLSLALFSCDPDDDNNAPAPVAEANNFKIGNNTYPMARGFRTGSEMDSPGLFVTFAVLTSDRITLDANQELAGTGNIVVFEFYTALNNGLQPGVYNLDNVNDQAQTVYVYTGVGYDGSTGNAASPDDIFEGTITEEALAGGNFKITGRGRADDADATFTVNYTGALQLVNQ